MSVERPLSVAAELDGEVVDMPDGTFPDLWRDCVVGPEEVVREGARESLDRSRPPESRAADR